MPIARWTSSVITAMALTLGASTLALAQPGHFQQRGGAHHHDRGGPRHQMPPGQGWHPGAKHAGPPAHAKGPRHHAHGPGAHHARGVGPQHQWYAGSRVPPQYRTPRHVVHDWRSHRLYQPPRGHQWVRHGNDYMLVAIASGVITQLILHSLY